MCLKQTCVFSEMHDNVGLDWAFSHFHTKLTLLKPVTRPFPNWNSLSNPASCSEEKQKTGNDSFIFLYLSCSIH